MRKILIITSLYPNIENPIRGIFVKKQVEELKQRNEVEVFATEISKSNSYKRFVNDDIEVHQTRYSFPKFIISPFFYYNAIKKNLIKLINKYQPDIIHIHDYKHIPELFVLSKIINFKKYNVILTMHNDKQIAEKYRFTNVLYQITLKHTLKKFPKIIVVSKKVKNLIAEYCNESNKIEVIGNGVEFDFPKINREKFKQFFPHQNKAFQIISVGNLVHTKGFDLLIQAVANLNRTGYNVELSIIGDGIEKDYLNDLIIENKIEDSIRLLGKVEHDIVMNLYPYYDAFVLPSWSETFGIVYLEAMLNKLPVIGVKGEGIDGIIRDCKNGYLVERNNVIKLVEKIILLMTAEDSEKIIKNGFQDVIENHLLSKVIKKIENIYE